MLAISGTGGSPAAPLTARSTADVASSATPVVTRRESLASGPYLYLQSNHLPDVRDVMRRTGVTGFTLAFMLSDGGCRAVWSGGAPVVERAVRLVREIRSAGGDVAVSFGGWAGLKLGQRCPDARALAAAYQRVIDRYGLRAIDVDIEWHEFESAAAQDRVLTALKIVESANPGIATSVTVPVTGDGLNSWGDRLVRRAVELRVPVDVWTIMPFVLGRPGADMARLTIAATEHVRHQLGHHHPGTPAAGLYRKLGISSMNGDTGAGETVTQNDFRDIRRYVDRRGLGRFTFWAVNRDRPCPRHGELPCSGVAQHPWEFTGIVGGGPRPPGVSP